MREERVVLEHQPDAAPLRRHEAASARSPRARRGARGRRSGSRRPPRCAAASSCRSRNGRAGRRARPASTVSETPSSARSGAVVLAHGLEGELRRDGGARRAALAPTGKAQAVTGADGVRRHSSADKPRRRARHPRPRAPPARAEAAGRGRPSSGSSSARRWSSSEGTGTDEAGGMRPSMKPAPFSSSRPGRSSTASRPKCSRKCGVVP